MNRQENIWKKKKRRRNHNAVFLLYYCLNWIDSGWNESTHHTHKPLCVCVCVLVNNNNNIETCPYSQPAKFERKICHKDIKTKLQRQKKKRKKQIARGLPKLSRQNLHTLNKNMHHSLALPSGTSPPPQKLPSVLQLRTQYELCGCSIKLHIIVNRRINCGV